jgi:hypothetical protein
MPVQNSQSKRLSMSGEVNAMWLCGDLMANRRVVKKVSPTSAQMSTDCFANSASGANNKKRSDFYCCIDCVNLIHIFPQQKNHAREKKCRDEGGEEEIEVHKPSFASELITVSGMAMMFDRWVQRLTRTA